MSEHFREYKLKNPFRDRPEPRSREPLPPDPLADEYPFTDDGRPTGTALPTGADFVKESRRALTVTQFAEAVNAVLEEGFPESVWVEGELSEPNLHTSGHFYFSLKDDQSSLRCVMWARDAARLKFRPEQGLKVLCFGKPDLWAKRGSFSFKVRTMEPEGMGALQLAFEQLKERLQAEGLFDEARKRPLPEFPQRIGVVTAPSGAAIGDMLRVLGGRVSVLLNPSRVQGEGAAESVARGIESLSRRGGLDLLIVGRGGGSLEDLWAFNEEPVARAIFNCPLPVISAVGHEKDVTIADLVADHRAATPTQAAERVLSRRAETLSRLLAALDSPAFAEPEEWLRESAEGVDELEQGLLEGLHAPLVTAAHRLQGLSGDLLSCSPQAFILHQAGRTHQLEQALRSETVHALERLAARVAALAGRLNALSPLAVLERGYSITFGPGGQVLKNAGSVRPGDPLETRLHEGTVISRVESTKGDRP